MTLAISIIKIAAAMATITLLETIGWIARKSAAKSPRNTNRNNTPSGMKKPNSKGTRHTSQQTNVPTGVVGNAAGLFCVRLVLTYCWRERAYSSSPNNPRMNKNPTEDICAAATRLFIPNHTLKMPRVMVGTAKYSTVPKSETTSIITNASPATMAGRANGNPTCQNCDLLCTSAISKRLAGVSRKAIRVTI